MENKKECVAIIKHLSGKQTYEEYQALLRWKEESEDNNSLYNEIKSLLDQSLQPSATLLGRFTFKRMNGYVMTQLIGKLIGFTVGLWLTHHFSYYVLEKKTFKNLFGLLERKAMLVNDTPDWLNWCLSVLAGFITFQIINHFIETKKHYQLWRLIKQGIYKVKTSKIK